MISVVGSFWTWCAATMNIASSAIPSNDFALAEGYKHIWLFSHAAIPTLTSNTCENIDRRNTVNHSENKWSAHRLLEGSEISINCKAAGAGLVHGLILRLTDPSF